MNNYDNIEINVSQNGIIRVYGNGGLILEASANDIRTHAYTHQKVNSPSGEAKQK